MPLALYNMPSMQAVVLGVAREAEEIAADLPPDVVAARRTPGVLPLAAALGGIAWGGGAVFALTWEAAMSADAVATGA